MIMLNLLMKWLLGSILSQFNWLLLTINRSICFCCKRMTMKILTYQFSKTMFLHQSRHLRATTMYKQIKCITLTTSIQVPDLLTISQRTGFPPRAQKIKIQKKKTNFSFTKINAGNKWYHGFSINNLQVQSIVLCKSTTIFILPLK